MPLYFAYGSNMSVAAMRQRCPRSKPVGLARLMRHALVVMEAGYASIERAPNASVHGLLWDLALADIPALDRYEGPLYRKVTQPVIRASGGSTQAIVYVGLGKSGGRASAEYAQEVLTAAHELNLPPAYLANLHVIFDVPLPRTLAEQPRPKVTPRFATPFDRG